MYHAVLSGDSIVDHAAHVAAGPDVPSQLEAELTSDWRVTLLGVDGDRMLAVIAQHQRLPYDASHLVVSVGGKRCPGSSRFLKPGSALGDRCTWEIRAIIGAFERAYHQMVQAVMHQRLPRPLCPISDSRFPAQVLPCIAITALEDT
jgi:hypothetical protein